MATPLKLKSERIGKIALAESDPYLSVLVDTGVFHLDQPYDYLLPAKYDVQIGQWVSVPFNGRNCQGLVISRSSRSKATGLLPINRPLKAEVIPVELLSLYREVAARWACPIFDVLRFVNRNRENALAKVSDIKVSGKALRSYHQLNPENSEIAQIKAIAEQLAESGRTLVIVPEARTAELLHSAAFEVGMRGAVLRPERFTNLVIVREESEHHYELKSPGFNTRDVALLRNQELAENLYFVGFSPSLEMARLLEIGFVSLKSASGSVQVIAKPSQMGELIPSALIKSFKEAVKKGPVLVLVPAKGYGLAISCADCRNIARCDCGGKLSKRAKSAPPFCVICNKEFPDWRCGYCHKDRIYLLGRGIERISEDFGKTFPNTPIHISTAEKKVADQITGGAIVLATIGAVPPLRYASVLFLEGLNLASDMRAEERYLSTLFRYTSMSKGRALIVERPESPIIAALIKWQPFRYLERLISELSQAGLPPSTRHALIKCDAEESARLVSGFNSAVRSGRLPLDTKIMHPAAGLISIFFTTKSAKVAIPFLYEFQKRRSMSGKNLVKLRIDPYLLG